MEPDSSTKLIDLWLKALLLHAVVACIVSVCLTFFYQRNVLKSQHLKTIGIKLCPNGIWYRFMDWNSNWNIEV